MSKIFCGIDLASLESNPTGISLLSTGKDKKPKVLNVLEVKTDEEIINLIKEKTPAITAIDSPFQLGLSSFRQCEDRLIKLGFKLFPPAFLIQLIKRTNNIMKHLPGELIEVHPRTSKIALGLHQSDTKKFIEEISGLVNELPDKNYSIHETDSLTGAYTAYLKDKGKTRSYGDHEGEIVVPVPKTFKLAVLDLDGTITKPASSWEYFHRRLGTWDIGKDNLEKFLANKINYKEFARADAAPWAGTDINKIQSIVEEIEYIEGVEKLIKYLRNKDMEVAIISGGLSVVADKVAKDFGIKHVFANDLNHNGKVLNGKVSIKIDYNGKLKIYKKLLKKLKVKPYEVMTFGDSGGDVVLFENSGFSVAINPISERAAKTAHLTVSSFNEVLDFLKL